LRALEVTWIPDVTINPPGPKMVVCVEPQAGFYFRINSGDDWKPCVKIGREPDHLWLKWDSHIECNILDLDDFVIEDAVLSSGVIGTVSVGVGRAILATVRNARFISPADKATIAAVLEPLCA
jgi:hypothetical protein